MFLVALALLANTPITTDSLLSQMVDFDALSRRPAPFYKTAQASSYDRRSVSRDNSTTEGWFANGDWGKYVRTEQNAGRTEYVMADLTGPGAVVRIWSANPFGTIRFYFDGEEAPRIECKTRDLLTGKVGFMKPPFGYGALRGCDLYFPIPYTKSLKVTVDNTDDNNATRMYYQIGYRTYETGTQVVSFDSTHVDRDLIESVAKTLQNPDGRSLPRGTERHSESYDIAPRDSVSIDVTQGDSGAITELVLKPFKPTLRQGARWSDPRQPHNMLRGLWLALAFDDKQTAFVPVADFFGSPPAGAAYKSFPMEVRPNGEMVCRFWMPFRRAARVELINVGAVRALGEVSVQVSPYEWGADSRYFHSQWTVDRGSTRPFRDFNFMDVKGSGHYVGSTLYVANTTPAWWGEGDEKVWVDGESFPSTFGTGTEDYYGYAWSDPTPYDNIPYHTQPNAGKPGCFGHIANNRFHVLDPITFDRSLRFDMEIWHWEEVHATFAATSYWYADDASSGPVVPNLEWADVEELLPPAPVEGAIEGEKMRIVERTGGTTENQGGFWALSSGEQLWWMDGKVGDRLVLEFDVPSDGTYSVNANLCHAVDYGIHEVLINGSRVGEFDFYGTGVTWKLRSFGTHALKQGKARIEVRVIGSNDKANPKRNMFGLDYVLLERT